MARRRRVERVTTHAGVRFRFEVKDGLALVIEPVGDAMAVIVPMEAADLAELKLLVETAAEHHVTLEKSAKGT
jgi:hypothetical protein